MMDSGCASAVWDSDSTSKEQINCTFGSVDLVMLMHET